MANSSTVGQPDGRWLYCWAARWQMALLFGSQIADGSTVRAAIWQMALLFGSQMADGSTLRGYFSAMT